GSCFVVQPALKGHHRGESWMPEWHGPKRQARPTRLGLQWQRLAREKVGAAPVHFPDAADIRRTMLHVDQVAAI
ncbi:hypothetical protein E4U43_007216, partial [Claviceps pusilla]